MNIVVVFFLIFLYNKVDYGRMYSMSLMIYNSLTNKLEEFVPHQKNKVNMYVCGPTVYNYIHIGNARPVVFFDMVKKYLEFLGYEVTYASNITDVDDKIIKKALEEGISEQEVAKRYEKAFFENVEALNSVKPDVIPHATEYVEEMVKFIQELEEKGYAYSVDGDVYFRINKLPSYGILSNQNQDELTNGVRISVNEKKESPLDFTLWKKTEEGIKWNSPFGVGRPGWHTECVVMNHKIFGQEIDIHGGGSDLKFPHHENEIAQSRALYGDNLSKYWMHVGRLDMNHQKMSKSLGNTLLVKDFVSLDELMTMRLLIVTQPYRSKIDYSLELYNQFNKEYEKIKRAYKQAQFMMEYHNIVLDEICNDSIEEFKLYMNQDFNTQNVLTLIIKLTKEMNAAYRTNDLEVLAKKLNALKTILDVLGIKVMHHKLTLEDKQIYDDWNKARIEKNFAKADELRQELVKRDVI